MKLMFGLAALLLALPLRLAFGVDPAPAPAERPAPKVGDVYEYAEKYQTVSCKRWEVKEIKEGMIVSRCGENTAYVSAENGNIVRIVAGDGKSLDEFKPYFPYLAFPMKIGKTWSAKYNGFTAIDGYTWDSNVTCEVKAFEKVKVPAGELPAYRIECKDSWQVGGFSGTDASTHWYSPAAQAVVKVASPERDKWNSELTSFTAKR